MHAKSLVVELLRVSVFPPQTEKPKLACLAGSPCSSPHGQAGRVWCFSEWPTFYCSRIITGIFIAEPVGPFGYSVCDLGFGNTMYPPMLASFLYHKYFLKVFYDLKGLSASYWHKCGTVFRDCSCMPVKLVSEPQDQSREHSSLRHSVQSQLSYTSQISVWFSPPEYCVKEWFRDL